MCGRFTLHSRLNLLLQQFAVEAGPEIAPRFNIAPTQDVPIVRASADGQRQMASLKWGLVPSWAKDPSMGSRLINARAETVADKPSFRTAFKRRRCLVPADGYYEWKAIGKKKQPYYIRLGGERPFGMAGLWESWHANQDEGLQTFTIITTNANEATQEVHDRMPVILAPNDYEMWLDPEVEDKDSLQSLLEPYDPNEIVMDAVSTYVNNSRHEGQECIAVQRELF